MARIKNSKDVYLPIFKTGITLILIWVIGIVLKRLPMLRDLSISKPTLSASRIVGMVVTLIVIVILANFAQEFGQILKRRVVHFPESGVIVASLIYIIAVLIGYNGFLPIGEILFEEKFWIYQIGFLALVLVPTVIGGITLYQNADKLIDIFTEGAALIKDQEGKVVCPNCGAKNMPDALYCIECGEELIFPEEEEESVVCPECGAENSADAKFCSQCGAELETSEEGKEPEETKTCPECGAENEQDATFCTECGTRLD